MESLGFRHGTLRCARVCLGDLPGAPAKLLGFLRVIQDLADRGS